MNSEQLGRVSAVIGKERNSLPEEWLASFDAKRRIMKYPPYRIFVLGKTAIFQTYRRGSTSTPIH